MSYLLQEKLAGLDPDPVQLDKVKLRNRLALMNNKPYREEISQVKKDYKAGKRDFNKKDPEAFAQAVNEFAKKKGVTEKDLSRTEGPTFYEEVYNSPEYRNRLGMPTLNQLKADRNSKINTAREKYLKMIHNSAVDVGNGKIK